MKKSFRYPFFWVILRPLVIAFLWLKFGYRFKVARNLPENYIVLSNHVTDFDPLFVGASFPRQMFYVASEHIARWPHAYKLLKFALAPILRYKGTVAASTVMDILRKTRDGENVCIFAEGARCWDGVTGPILPSTGKLVKNARCGLVTYKITGGYFLSPNWSEGHTCRGWSYGAPVGVYTKEEIAAMSVKEVNELIVRDLFEDAYARQLADPKPYTGRNIAQRMENMLFICPRCGSIDTIRSEGDKVSCSCGMSFTYDKFGMLHGIEHETVRELYAWQLGKVDKLAASGGGYTAPSGVLRRVAGHEETVAAEGEICLDGEKIRVGDWEAPRADISDLAMHGRHSIVFSIGKEYYDLIVDKDSCALKFHLLYDAYKK